MYAAQTKKLVNLATIIVLVVLAFWYFYHTAKKTQSTADMADRNYSRMICDDAYTTERHFGSSNPPYFDVILHEKCFSGFIEIPKSWLSWQFQFLGNDPTDWMSEWYASWPDPKGPYSQAAINGGTIQFGDLPIKMLRVKGKGTVRIYRTTGDMRNTPPPPAQ
jgi:hypothetical protein